MSKVWQPGLLQVLKVSTATYQGFLDKNCLNIPYCSLKKEGWSLIGVWVWCPVLLSYGIEVQCQVLDPQRHLALLKEHFIFRWWQKILVWGSLEILSSGKDELDHLKVGRWDVPCGRSGRKDKHPEFKQGTQGKAKKGAEIADGWTQCASLLQHRVSEVHQFQTLAKVTLQRAQQHHWSQSVLL